MDLKRKPYLNSVPFTYCYWLEDPCPFCILQRFRYSLLLYWLIAPLAPPVSADKRHETKSMKYEPVSSVSSLPMNQSHQKFKSFFVSSLAWTRLECPVPAGRLPGDTGCSHNSQGSWDRSRKERCSHLTKTKSTFGELTMKFLLLQ